MIENPKLEKLLQFKKNLSRCVNVKHKEYQNKELILSNTSIKKTIGFITSGKATIIKTDENGNTIILRELKENDIFSNLFYSKSDDEIFIISNNYTDVIIIDYHSIIKNCKMNCPFHNNIVLYLYDLLIEDNRQQIEKIELLSKRTVRDKLLFFMKKRMNKDNVFRVTTSFTAIAEYICVDRSNLMRELNKMEDEGLIERDGRQINILI